MSSTSSESEAVPELAIVGAGPVGLYAAYYAGFRAMRTVVFESLPFVGGQIATFYPESLLYDVPGFAEVRGDELIRRLEAQARRFPIDFRLGTRVTRLEPAGDAVQVHFEPETKERSENASANPRGALSVAAVLLTTGIGRFVPQPIPSPEIESFRGRGLDYHLADPATLSGKRVLVAGGTQRGVELALALASVRADVVLIHRRDRLAIPSELQDRLRASPVRFLPFRELAALEGTLRVERAILEDPRDRAREAVAVDAALPCFGFSAHADDLSSFAVRLDGDAAVVDPTMATSAPRVWAAGDGASYPGKVRILAADFGEACTAVNNLAGAIVPGAPVFPGYSSHRQGAAQRPRPARVLRNP